MVIFHEVTNSFVFWHMTDIFIRKEAREIRELSLDSFLQSYFQSH